MTVSGKEVFYSGSRFRMSDETLNRYIKQLIEAHQVDEVTIAWQGGEPTIMGLDFFRRAMVMAPLCRRPKRRVDGSNMGRYRCGLVVPQGDSPPL